MKTQIALIVSDYNPDITHALRDGALSRLTENGVDKTQIFTFHVPGAVEIPLTAQWLAKTNQYAAIICLGAVIKGDTDHYIYVCEQASQGCQKVMLEFNIPVIFGVLTTTDKQQAIERIGGKHGHKGIEAADAALQMIAIKDKIYT